MASVVFFADKPRKEVANNAEYEKNPPSSEGDEGIPAQWQGGHLVIEPVSLTPSTVFCNLMNPKYRDEKVQNMQPMQTECADAK